MKDSIICGLSLEDYLIRMEEFHGYRSPGLLIGGIMVDVALRQLGSTPYLNVVTETVVCLPDAVQLLTPCTIGNGFLQVLDWGKFALTCYDRLELSGVRVRMKSEALSDYPLIRDWFERSNRTREKPRFEDLTPEILAGGEDLVAYRHVRLHKALKDTAPVHTVKCPDCKEFYAKHLGPACPHCSGEGYCIAK